MEKHLTVCCNKEEYFDWCREIWFPIQNGVYNVRKYINISTVFVAVSVIRFYIWERLLSAVATLSCL